MESIKGHQRGEAGRSECIDLSTELSSTFHRFDVSPQYASNSDLSRSFQVFSYVGKWSVEDPTVFPGIEGDKGLVLKSKAAHHAISAPFDATLDPAGKPLIVSYEVKLQKGLDCGGAYVKLLSESDNVRSIPSRNLELNQLTKLLSRA